MPDMRLVRFCTIVLVSKRTVWNNIELLTQDCVVRIIDQRKKDDRGNHLIIALAVSNIDFQLITDDGYIIIPDEERILLEYNLINISNFIALAERTKKTILSPKPSVAIQYFSDEELEILKSSNGFKGKSRSLIRPYSTFQLSDETLNFLSDRIDGAALLSEALAQENDGGRFKELVRFFERAFILPFSKIDKKMQQFLDLRMGYTRDEIRSWIALRDGAIHADSKFSKNLVFEIDVLPFIARMEQAAYDCLFNKDIWASKDTKRRTGWSPALISTNPFGDSAQLNRGNEEYTIDIKLYDEFSIFTRDNLSVLHPLHPPLWSCWEEEAQTSFPIEAIGEE